MAQDDDDMAALRGHRGWKAVAVLGLLAAFLTAMVLGPALRTAPRVEVEALQPTTPPATVAPNEPEK